MKWFLTIQKEIENEFNNSGRNSLIFLKVFRMMGIGYIKSIVNAIKRKSDFFNKNEQWKSRYLKNLIKTYKKRTKKELEVAVEKFSEKDIYSGEKMLQSIGAKNNYDLIARITTQFFLELKRRYSKFFADETSLLAAAGILDAQWYIFSGNMDSIEIINIAEKAQKTEDPLLNFIMDLIIKILISEEPNASLLENSIQKICEEQREIITKAIEETKKKYKGEDRIIFDTEAFMISEEFKKIREKLNIKTNE